MTVPSQIAVEVLTKLSEEEWGIPRMMAVGGGLGLGGGLLGSSIRHINDIKNLLKLHHQRPRLEQAHKELSGLLQNIKKEQPHLQKLRPRVLTKALLQNKGQIPPEAYYTARRGYEEGLAGLSRNNKLTQLLRKRLLRSGSLGAGLGLGAGVGAGLLAAVGSGKFDKQQS